MHDNRLLRLAVLGIINNRGELVPWNQKDITLFKEIRRIGLHDFRFRPT
jgi:hypothetical protein